MRLEQEPDATSSSDRAVDALRTNLIGVVHSGMVPNLAPLFHCCRRY